MSGRWYAIAAVGGALAGAVWGLVGSGGYETGEVVIGTAILCAIAGLAVVLVAQLVTAIARTVKGRRRAGGEDVESPH